LSVYQVVV